MDERTEDLALRRVLPIAMGGARYELRTLTIDESDAWLRLVAERLAAIEDDLFKDSGVDSIAALLTASSRTVVGLVAAYDLEDTLGGEAAIRGRMSKPELRAAMDAMVTAEDPFGEAVARSVAEGFGVPSRFLASGMRMVLAETALSQLASSTTGLSEAMGSTTALSALPGAASSSSSAGRTRRTASTAKRKSA